MKKLFALLVCGMASYAFCGQLTWSAGTFTETFKGGTGYLIATTNTSATIQSIASYLTTKGTSYAGGDFAVRGPSGSVTNLDEQYLIANVVGGSGSISTSDNGKSFFVVVLSSDGKQFALSQFTVASITGDENWTTAFGLDESYQPIDNYWTTGKVYSDTPVPEPGMLALLALGVAGLALRRKVA